MEVATGMHFVETDVLKKLLFWTCTENPLKVFVKGFIFVELAGLQFVALLKN